MVVAVAVARGGLIRCPSRKKMRGVGRDPLSGWVRAPKERSEPAYAARDSCGLGLALVKCVQLVKDCLTAGVRRRAIALILPDPVDLSVSRASATDLP
jgi:hypothetical protein